MQFKDKQKTLFERKSKLVKKATPSELLFKSMLEENGIDFKFQKGFIQGNNYCIVDFYLPKPHKICIEIDGPYHETEEQKKRDAIKDFYLTKQRNFRMVRIKNEDVSSFDIKSLFS